MGPVERGSIVQPTREGRAFRSILKDASLRVIDVLNFPEKLWSRLLTSAHLHTLCVGLRADAAEHQSPHKGKGKAEAPQKHQKRGKRRGSVAKRTFNLHEALGSIPSISLPRPPQSTRKKFSIPLSEQAMIPTQATQDHLQRHPPHLGVCYQVQHDSAHLIRDKPGACSALRDALIWSKMTLRVIPASL